MEFDCAGSGWENQGATLINLAPELIRAARSNPEDDAPPLFSLYGPPADVWALGLTAYNWLTGGCLFALRQNASPPDTAWGKDDCEIIRKRRRLADLHAEWVSGASASFVFFSPSVISCTDGKRDV
jgi:hypothetical protein